MVALFWIDIFDLLQGGWPLKRQSVGDLGSISGVFLQRVLTYASRHFTDIYLTLV